MITLSVITLTVVRCILLFNRLRCFLGLVEVDSSHEAAHAEDDVDGEGELVGEQEGASYTGQDVGEGSSVFLNDLKNTKS
jgi:hypothetical protein